MNKITLNVYRDPGHSWVQVRKDFLTELIHEDWRSKFSTFSHEKGEFAYLEEDDDAPTLVRILKESEFHVDYTIHDSDNLSPIRNYPTLSLF